MIRNRHSIWVGALTLLGIAVVGQAAADVMFYDNFDSGMSPEWVVINGNYWVEEGWLHAEDPPGGPRESMAVVHAGDMSWTDYTFSCWLDNLSTGAPWELARVNFRTERAELGPSWPLRKAYELGFHVDNPPGTNRLWLNHNDDWGESYRLATINDVVTPDPMFVEVTVTGPRLRVWLNGDPMIDVVDPTPIAYGGIAVGAHWEAHARFDEVLVVPEPASLALTAFACLLMRRR